VGSPHPVRRSAAAIYDLAVGEPLQPLVDAARTHPGDDVAHFVMLDEVRLMKARPGVGRSRELLWRLNRVCEQLESSQRCWDDLATEHLAHAARQLFFLANEAGGRTYPLQDCLSERLRLVLGSALVFEPLDRLSIQLVIDGRSWSDAQQVVRAAVADPIGVGSDVAR
jgi:hypothetical protein